jgi:hypothetical protein
VAGPNQIANPFNPLTCTQVIPAAVLIIAMSAAVAIAITHHLWAVNHAHLLHRDSVDLRHILQEGH